MNGSRAGDFGEEYVARLRLYPHALREANAYYSPTKKSILFGYFPAARRVGGMTLPQGLVFTCLSPEIIAHETTLALLDGTRRLVQDGTNPDVLAFHLAFGDLVSLFQSFGQPEWLSGQIAQTRGDLTGSQAFLAELAHQSVRAVDRYAALRDGIGTEPDPSAYETTLEPYARASILVAAVFDAYLAIYQGRVANLLEIARQGNSLTPAGPVSPVLARMMADEASRTARHVLRMCIRALDYCPPLDLTYGDFLRALLTADRDLFAADDRSYRPIFVEAFRRRGIYPRDVRTLSVESLCWRSPAEPLDLGPLLEKLELGTGPEDDRRRIAEGSRRACQVIGEWLNDLPKGSRVAEELGLSLDASGPGGLYRDHRGRPRVGVHSARTAWRMRGDGRVLAELIVELSQRRRGYRDTRRQQAVDGASGSKNAPKPDFVFQGGCALLIDLSSGRARYCVTKSVLNESRLDRQRAYRKTAKAGDPELSPTPTRGF